MEAPGDKLGYDIIHFRVHFLASWLVGWLL